MTIAAETTESAARSRLAQSARAETGRHTTSEFHEWLDRRRAAIAFDVEHLPLGDLENWSRDSDSGDLVHDSGRFFSVRGMRVSAGDRVGTGWSQPVINQPEVGVLGLLMHEFDGILHALVQAKAEPGNAGGVQISLTVQATRSNYSRVHGGAPVRYIEHFVGTEASHALVDVLQSEQGAWFFHKRNRNMVVETSQDVGVHEDFFWLTLAQLRSLLLVDDLVSMDLRTVLSCTPLVDSADDSDGESFDAVVRRSLGRVSTPPAVAGETLRWFTDAKANTSAVATLVPLRQVDRWTVGGASICHQTGRYFEVVGARVTVSGREVAQWDQPMIAPCGVGVVAFLTRIVDGDARVLVRARREPGFMDLVELGPTVQCIPGNYAHLPVEHWPPYLDLVLDADPADVRYSVALSEEGGRFYRALNTYSVIEVHDDLAAAPGFRWVSIGELAALLVHSNYLNIQARSLIACMHALW